jgi:8-oxo-dGTP pyrophosphatase MutT (NUDIX family)
MELPIITAAGGLVQNSNGEFLLMYRRGFWDLPKGKLDAGESIPDCAVREVQEETGLQSLELGPFICTTTHPYFDTWLNKDVVKHTHWFSMLSLANDTLVPQTEEDIEKLVWATVPELPEYLNNTYPTIRAVFEAFNAGIPKF